MTTIPMPTGFFKAPNPDPRTSADDNHDKWIDVLSTDWGTHKPGA